jgi:hypothetical protein
MYRRAIHGIQTSPKLSTKIMVASTSFQVQLGDQNTGNSAARKCHFFMIC